MPVKGPFRVPPPSLATNTKQRYSTSLSKKELVAPARLLSRFHPETIDRSHASRALYELRRSSEKKPSSIIFSNLVFELWHTFHLLQPLLIASFWPCATNSRHLRLERQSGLGRKFPNTRRKSTLQTGLEEPRPCDTLLLFQVQCAANHARRPALASCTNLKETLLQCFM